MTRRFAAGIDLHGTLLDEAWRVPVRLAEELVSALGKVRESCEVFLCTGNDLTFVERHIEDDLARLFDGFVLETGCVVCRGSGEEVLVPPEALSVLKELERQLRNEILPEVHYFGRRLATISMFTKTEVGGSDPAQLHPHIVGKVNEMGYGEEVLVTHSDVAVDIIPAGFNKFEGLRLASEAPSLIGIADSFNDLHLIQDADFAFLPANASPKLLAELRNRGRQIVPLHEWHVTAERTIAISESRHTEAVIEVLHTLRHHLQ